MANEKRLDVISRSALIEDLRWLKSVVSESNKNDVQDFIDRVESFPEADAVLVVRCKDCNYGKLDDAAWCHDVYGNENDTTLYHCLYGFGHNKCDHFCSYGERRTE